MPVPAEDAVHSAPHRESEEIWHRHSQSPDIILGLIVSPLLGLKVVCYATLTFLWGSGVANDGRVA